MNTISPRAISKLRSSSATWPPANCFPTWKNWIIAAGSEVRPTAARSGARRRAAVGQSGGGPEAPAQGVLHGRRLRASAGALHHLADEESQHLDLTGAVLRGLRGALGDHGVDPGVDLRGVVHLPQTEAFG